MKQLPKLLSLIFIFILLFINNKSFSDKSPYKGYNTMKNYTLLTKNIRRFKLHNGITFVFKYNENISKVEIRLNFKVGLLESKYFGSQMAHLFEHLLINGDDTYKKFTDDLGAFGSNGSTHFNYTNYIQKINTKNLEKGLQLFSKFIDPNRQFNEKLIENEIEVILKEDNLHADDPSSMLSIRISDLAFRDSNSKGTQVGNLRSSIKSISKEDIHDFYKKNYIPQNLTIFLVGDFDFNKAEEYAVKYFSKFNQVPTKAIPYDRDGTQVKPRKTFTEYNHKNMHHGIGFVANNLDNKDFIALEVLKGILQYSPELYKNLIIKNSDLISNYYIDYECSKEDIVFLFLFTNLKKQDIQKTNLIKEILFKELENLASNLDETSLKNYINKILLNFMLNKKHISFEIRYIEFLESLNALELYPKWEDLIKNVTIKDIKNVIRKYFNPSSINEVILFPKGNTKLKQDILSINTLNENVGEMTYEMKLKKLYNKITPVKLKNGITLFFNPLKDDLTYFNVYLNPFKSSYMFFDPKGKEGLYDMLESFFKKGSKNISEENLIKKLSTLGRLSIKGSKLFGISLKQNFQDLFNLAIDLVLNPDFEKHINRVKKETVFLYNTKKDSLYTLDTFLTFFNLKEFDLTYEKIIKNITTFTVKDFENLHKKLLSKFYIFISGNLNQDKIISQLENLKFQNLKLSEPLKINSEFKDKNEVVSKLISERKQSSISFNFSPIDKNEHNLVQASLLSVLLYAAFSDGPSLYNELRVKRDLAYAITPELLHLNNKILFKLRILTVKEKNKDVEKIVIDFFKDMKENPISNKIFESIKSQTISYIESSLVNMDKSITSDFLESYVKDTPTKYRFIEAIKKSTKSELVEFIKKTIDLKNYLTIHVHN